MKDTELVLFSNHEIGEIKGFIKNGEPWFLAAQVCRCLGIKDASRAVSQIKERMKIAEYKGTTSSSILIDTQGGRQKALVIPEAYLYELIFASRKQKAIKFRAWVTTEVLPAIRKHGEYRTGIKLITKDLHENIKEKTVPQIESETGKKFIYSSFHKLINNSLGYPDSVNRDDLTDKELENLANRENLVNSLVYEGKKYSEVKEILKGLVVTGCDHRAGLKE
jgi:prophage antirepressor-like protein